MCKTMFSWQHALVGEFKCIANKAKAKMQFPSSTQPEHTLLPAKQKRCSVLFITSRSTDQGTVNTSPSKELHSTLQSHRLVEQQCHGFTIVIT